MAETELPVAGLKISGSNGYIGNILSTMGGIAIAIAAAYAIISSYVNPIQLRIDMLHDNVREMVDLSRVMSELTIRTDVDLANMKSQFLQHGALPGHPSTVKELAAQEVQFVEVETQFKNLDERTERIQHSFNTALTNLDNRLQREVAVQKAEIEKIIENLNETSDSRHQINKLRIEEMQDKIMIHIENLQKRLNE